jgi:hypothetical protein
VLYGAIIGLALVVALEAHPPAAGAVAATLLGMGVATALADIFAEYVGAETRARARPTREQVVEIVRDAAAVVVGVAMPAVFFVLATLSVFDRDTAFALATWSGVGLIAAYGFAAARLTGAGVWQSLRRAALAALIGAFLIAVKALVH